MSYYFKITLKYTNENFSGINYEEVILLKVVSITAPYQINANNVIEYLSPVVLYDNAVKPYEIFVNVLDKISSFSAVRVSLATKLDEGDFLENEEYFNNLQITYGTQVPRKESFEIPAGFSADKYFDKEIGVWLSTRKKLNVELLISAEIGTFALEHCWTANQKIEQREDGSVWVSFETTQLQEIKRWVLGQGKTVKVLVENVSRDNKSELLGKTEQDERVAFAADKNLIGSFAMVHIDSLSGNTFRGTLIK